MTAALTSTGISFIDTTQTTSNMNVFAGHSAGSVGSYAMLRPTGGVAYYGPFSGYAAPVGTTVAGSGLYYSNAYGQNQTVYTAATGTWKLLSCSKSTDSGSNFCASFFVRIA